MLPVNSRVWCTMSGKQTSGDCRSISLAVVLLLFFCIALAGAADCPSGCSCLQPADAKEKGYDPCGGQLSSCGNDVLQRTLYCYKTPPLSFVPRTLQTLVIATTTTQPGTCAAGCSCMLEADAKEKFGTYSRCSETPCYTVYTGSTSLKAYCFRQGTPPVTTTPVPSCPQGCTCLSDVTAKERYGTYTRCTDTVCGYDMPANRVAAYQVPKYCVKQGSTTPVCPEGCTCITDAMAKQRYGDYTRCSENACGYEQDQTAKYCTKPGSTTPVCPEGCNCLTDGMAKERYGTFTRCSAEVCGYEPGAPTNALASNQIPKYCVKGGSTPVCPGGCACLSDEDAKLKGLTERCDTSQTPCGYKADTGTTTALRRIPLYCYKIPTDATPVCSPGCYCLQEADARLKFGPGNYSQCQADICGYDPSATTANGLPKYCFKPTVTPASLACPPGCYCVHEVDMKNKFGPNNYTQCRQEPCLFDMTVGEPAYCFRPTVPVSGTPTPEGCRPGCFCLDDAAAKEKGLSPCGGVMTSCGYDEMNQRLLYCFGEASAPSCVYDYQNNICTGYCRLGSTCGLLASQKDATGKVVYAACGCTEPPATPCAYDAQKNACTGTCQTGAACSVVGKNVDEKTGATIPVCGCPQQTSCVYDYSKEACAGTCTVTGENCQLNTIYRDPSTGKVTFAECHCKGSGAENCAFNAQNYCIGNCPQGGQCANTSVVDASGKMTFLCTCAGGSNCVLTANNECSGTCVTGAPCARIISKDDSGNEKVSCGCGGISPVSSVTRQPGVFGGIADFFTRLFGGK